MPEFEYTPELIRKMQLVELEILREVDRICRKHGMIYLIDGGTALGAVRHGGFIPWDDDIDVQMLRTDYDRFCEICKTELDSGKYFLQTYLTDSGYRWGYARILKNGTVFHRNEHEMVQSRNGIFIDIFPRDNMPETVIPKTIFNVKCFLARKISYSIVGKLYDKNMFKRCLYRMVSAVPMSRAIGMYEKLAHEYENRETGLVRTPGWHWKQERKGYQKSWMTDYQEIQFEDMMVYAPKDVDGFLRYMYGDDYMILPPEDRRKPQHPATNIIFGDDEQ